MTFDEAVDKILFDSFEDTHDDDVIYTEDVISLIKSLKEEYAPTVEMTKDQVNVINSFKNNFSANYLPEVIHNQPVGDWSFLDELSGKLFGHRQGGMTDKNIEDIMRIWLHPETIKEVD